MKLSDPVTNPPPQGVRVLVFPADSAVIFARLREDGTWIDDQTMPVKKVTGWMFLVAAGETE